jgi:hypothetical protein
VTDLATRIEVRTRRIKQAESMINFLIIFDIKFYSQVKNRSPAIDAIVDEGVVEGHILVHHELHCLLSCNTSQETTHAVLVATAIADQLSDVPLLNWNASADLVSHKLNVLLNKVFFVSSILVVFSKVMVFLAELFKSSNAKEPLDTTCLVAPKGRHNRLFPIWLHDFVSHRTHKDSLNLF